ncbi:hypothetical protein XcuCFBP2542_18575, partial [Xanthomonas cucurbitae]
TMFSLSVLTFTVSLATKVVGAVGVAFLAKWALNGGNGEGISSMALQQGGVGLVLTTLIITAPPMAAAFFQGTLGQFTAYSALGGGAAAAAVPAGPGGSYVPRQIAADTTNSDASANTAGRVAGSQMNSVQQQDVGRMAKAPINGNS